MTMATLTGRYYISPFTLTLRALKVAQERLSLTRLCQQIPKNRRVTISEFKGTTLVNIREYYEKDNKFLPGKKVGRLHIFLMGR